ncbi:MAG: peptide chain release factor N(5)-glutamine methyltransferase [Clostridia bacterium]|nr:peptide chain release factor N(5)-glutamine methyltransferase [Clostridia bacterium]
MVKTAYDAYLDLRNELRLAGVAGSNLEAREIIAHVLKLDPESLYARQHIMVFDEDLEKIMELRDRRLAGTPVQHLIGQWDFYSLTFEVTPDTLIPRADTEELARCGIEFLAHRQHARILDLCCGTGCVGIAVMKNVGGETHGVFADLSQPALRVARNNIERHGLNGTAVTSVVNALEPLSTQLGKFQLIVCNPPYIPHDEIATLDVEVRNEPHMALDGGADGLDFYRSVAGRWARAIRQGGRLLFEVGIRQADPVEQILARLGYSDIATWPDDQGILRVVEAMMKT